MNRYCGVCGTMADAEDQFCPGCGKPMQGAVAPPPPAYTPRAPAYAPQAQAPVYAPPPPPRPAYAPPVPPAPPPSFAPSTPPKQEAQWYYAVGGKQQGPVAESVLRVALQNLPADTLVWQPGLPNWKTAEASGLKTPPAPSFAPPTPPPPPSFAPPAYAPPAPAGFAPPPPARPGYAPPPAFAPPAPAFGATPYGSAPAASGEMMPPNMHWLVLLILSWVTGGLAGLVWSFKQAFFVKRLDPSSKAVMLLTVVTVGMVAQVALYIGALSSRSASTLATAGMLVMVLNLVIIICGLMMVFGMRSSIVRYYNSTENIGLKLSGVMTFFFSILYFQYHFSRIVEWKKTGRLS